MNSPASVERNSTAIDRYWTGYLIGLWGGGGVATLAALRVMEIDDSADHQEPPKPPRRPNIPIGRVALGLR